VKILHGPFVFHSFMSVLSVSSPVIRNTYAVSHRLPQLFTTFSRKRICGCQQKCSEIYWGSS